MTSEHPRSTAVLLRAGDSHTSPDGWTVVNAGNVALVVDPERHSVQAAPTGNDALAMRERAAEVADDVDRSRDRTPSEKAIARVIGNRIRRLTV